MKFTTSIFLLNFTYICTCVCGLRVASCFCRQHARRSIESYLKLIKQLLVFGLILTYIYLHMYINIYIFVYTDMMGNSFHTEWSIYATHTELTLEICKRAYFLLAFMQTSTHLSMYTHRFTYKHAHIHAINFFNFNKLYYWFFFTLLCSSSAWSVLPVAFSIVFLFCFLFVFAVACNWSTLWRASVCHKQWHPSCNASFVGVFCLLTLSWSLLLIGFWMRTWIQNNIYIQ